MKDRVCFCVCWNTKFIVLPKAEISRFVGVPQLLLDCVIFNDVENDFEYDVEDDFKFFLLFVLNDFEDDFGLFLLFDLTDCEDDFRLLLFTLNEFEDNFRLLLFDFFLLGGAIALVDLDVNRDAKTHSVISALILLSLPQAEDIAAWLNCFQISLNDIECGRRRQ